MILNGIRIISNICTKVNRTLGFLRNFIFSCPRCVKADYKKLLHPVLEYGSSFWESHTLGLQATKTMGFLRRNLTFGPRHTKEVAYKTLVRSQHEYTAPIWHPYHKTQIGQVVKVQRTAARWTCRRWRNTSFVGDMFDELEWPSLETRREQSCLAFFY